MARITYTVSCCPHCGQEISNDSWKTFPWIMACIGTMFTIFFWLIGIAIINKIFDYEKISIGNPYYKCPHCKKEIRSIDTFEWEDLKDSFKKKWTFRYLIRICYGLSGLILFLVVIPLITGLWSSKLEADIITAKVFLIIMIISLVLIIFIYYRWKKYDNSKIFVVAERDVETIKQSWGRTRKINPQYNSTDKIKVWGTDRIIKLKEVKVEENGNDDEVDNELEEDSNLTLEEQEELKEKLELAKKSMEKGIITYSQYSKIKDEIEESLGISNEEDDDKELDEEDEKFDIEDCDDDIDSRDAEDFEEAEELDGEDNDEELNDEDGIEEDDDYDFEEISRKIDNKNKKHIIVVKKSNKE